MSHFSQFFYVQEVPLDALVNVFFLYAFIGWCMECVVIRIQNGDWENRGFTRLPFCIIYGFGGMLGYACFSPLSGHPVLLGLIAAAAATVFEFLTAKVMLRLFGELWWDYSRRPFNYKGILCLESSVAWGVLLLFVVFFLEGFLFRIVLRLPRFISRAAAGLLLLAYAVDFLTSIRRAAHARAKGGEGVV